ncbi:MAG: hypothetical protein Q9170_006849 [Blastenia crenularia]
MGTLTDITSRAINKNMRAGGSPMLTPKGSPYQSENGTKSNFMTPTMASAKKANAASVSKEHVRSSTPNSVGVEKAVTGKWMTSAVRRVGLRRVGGDGTPRSKKEGSKHASNSVLTFPDKLSVSQEQMRTPPSSLSNKPLPSPPIAQIKSDHLEEPRSLIDASEKPLRRTSPKSSQNGEDWPVLFPQKPTSPDAIREMSQSAPLKPTYNASQDHERYPLLRGSNSMATDFQQKSLTKVPSTHKIRRKEPSTSSLRREQAEANHSYTQLNDDGDQAVDQALTKMKGPEADIKADPYLSARAAAVEKASAEVKSIKEPRQTRTSSLRARISAGQVIKDSPNKVLGFTDFTVEKVLSSKASSEEMRAGVSFRAKPSSSFSKAFGKKPSRESLGGSRAPAQFVAGSRRPTGRRPSSRNSLRNDSRAPSPAFPEPSRPAPLAPKTKTDNTTRRSSIPIPHNTPSVIASKANSEHSSDNHPIEVKSAKVETGFHDESGVSSDERIDVPEERKRDASYIDHLDVKPALESIEESPKSTFRSKRLSSNHARLGPTLKVSSSANRLIMGTGEPNKENRPLIKRKSKDLFRAAVTNEYRNVTKNNISTSGQNTTSNRPLSSQGFPENRPGGESHDNEHKIKRIRSIDMGNVFSLATSELEISAVNAEEKEKEKYKDSSAVEEPFSEAVGQRSSLLEKSGEQKLAGSELAGHISPVSVVSPVKGNATPMSDTIPVVPAFLPKTLQEHVSKNELSETAASKAGHSALDIKIDVQADSSHQSSPTTPQSGPHSNGSAASSGFPPRSSSRMQHPDHTISGSTKRSSPSPTDQSAAQSQEAVLPTHSAKAVSDGDKDVAHPSKIGSRAPYDEISSQTILADKRDSTAQESTKSQASMSKGLMSNFRGLFHKRASDNSETSITRSVKKGGKRINVTAHGSPSPSMSNIHPIHRPTQASLNRAGANTHRRGSHGITSFAPSTPSFASPVPSEVSTTTNLAMQIIESARRESSSPKKERLLELGQLLVNTITQAHDAEKAMEEARQAARKAEVAHALCKRSVSDVAGMVREWRGEINRI